ncbi:hypothetical protein KP509_18G072000 [Ceratopteris richardii]|nr:hypothetical protein KP509_18G072000 [Ceratopteris richardii]
MTPFNRRTSHRVSHTHGTDEGKDLSAPSSKHHVSLPEFGSWDVDTSSSSEGYTKAFDHARGLKKELVRSHQLPRNDFQQIVSEGDSKP